MALLRGTVESSTNLAAPQGEQISAQAEEETLSKGKAAEGRQGQGGGKQERLQAHSRDPLQSPGAHLEHIPTCSPRSWDNWYDLYEKLELRSEQ